jgi:hypothetical protein
MFTARKAKRFGGDHRTGGLLTAPAGSESRRTLFRRFYATQLFNELALFSSLNELLVVTVRSSLICEMFAHKGDNHEVDRNRIILRARDPSR